MDSDIDLTPVIAGTLAISLFIWCATKSPFLRWLLKMLFFTAWGFGTVGVALIATGDYLYHGFAFSAIVALIAMIPMSAAWAFIGLPELIRIAKDRRQPLWN